MLEEILLFVLVGFIAQMVDGAVGMAYGLIATSVLLSMSVSPAVASASIHAAEMFTTGASGLAHWRAGNVVGRLVLRLAIPGVLGGALGAYVLTDLPVEIMKPVVSAYLIVMGLVILRRALRGPTPPPDKPPGVMVLGFGGGFVDAIGGGGWGPLVTSTLIGRGNVARTSIGSTNAAEFFVTTAITAVFVTTIGLELWPVILGLVLGGVLAAPLAALVTKKLPDRPLMIIVGLAITLLSLRNIIIQLNLV